MRKILVLLVIVLAISSSVSAQAKIGIYNPFYIFSTQASANGMGEVGVSFTGDNNYYFNPANLGLLAFEKKIFIFGYPKKPDMFGIDIYNAGISFPVSINEHLKLGIAYNFSKIGANLSVTSYEFPLGTDEYKFYGDRFHRVTLGLGYKNKFELAVGVNMTYINEDLLDLSNNTTTFDFGLRAGYGFVAEFSNGSQLIVNPSFGFSYSNVWNEINYEYYSYDIPDIKRYGLSTKITYRKVNKHFTHDFLSMLWAYENESINAFDTSATKYGVEIELFESFSFRLGQNNLNELDEIGFSVQLTGFRKFIQAGVSDYDDRSLLNRLNLTFNFARQSEEWTYYPVYDLGLPREPAYTQTYDYDYYELIVSFEL